MNINNIELSKGVNEGLPAQCVDKSYNDIPVFKIALPPHTITAFLYDLFNAAISFLITG